jgi:D-lactate dehydratase
MSSTTNDPNVRSTEVCDHSPQSADIYQQLPRRYLSRRDEDRAFFTEALHPFEVLTQAGFEVDLATETGTYGLDDLSLTDRFLARDDKAVLENSMHPFNVKLNSQLKKATDLNVDEYGLFFGSAGHAALYDYPTARGLQAAAEDVWRRGGIVSAVCHGPVILPGVIDRDTGKSIVEGKTVTGFTVEGEIALKVLA